MATNLPDRPRRFLCDVMLARFARYLRAAGHDTRLAAGTLPDREVVGHAVAEGRWLLTADRGIMDHRLAAGRTLLLPHGSLDAQAAALSAAFDLDWLGRAFTRCLVDNAELGAPDPAQLAIVPPGVRETGTAVYACPACGRLYWHGTHTRRMGERLARWQDFPRTRMETTCR